MSKILFIINPAGYGGAGLKAWKRFQKLWPHKIDPKDVVLTKRPRHAREIAATCKGYDVIACVGGDGTVNEILSGIMDRKKTRPKLAVIPAGTGNDIARVVGMHSVNDAVKALDHRQTKKFDIVRVDYKNHKHRYAFLYSVVGFTPNYIAKPWIKRYLGPKVGYYLVLLIATLVYRAPHMDVLWNKGKHKGRTWVVVIGNAERISGGHMCIAPGAMLDDGKFNVSVIPAQSKLKMLTKMLPKIPTGMHTKEPGVLHFLTKKIVVDSDPPTRVEIDGEIHGMTPCTFTILPMAAKIISSR